MESTDAFNDVLDTLSEDMKEIVAPLRKIAAAYILLILLAYSA